MSTIVIAGAMAVVATALVLVLVVVPWHARSQLADEGASRDEVFSATTERRRVVVEAAAAALLLIGAIVGFREFQATKQRQDSERFAQAVELLGSSDATTAIGAVYGLEGVARSDGSYYPIVDDTLSALIRSRAPYSREAAERRGADEPVDPVVQAAITVLGRVPDRSDRELDLSRSDLRYVDFHSGDFRNAAFVESNLFEVEARGADFRGADFTSAAVGTELCDARLGDNEGLPAEGC